MARRGWTHVVTSTARWVSETHDPPPPVICQPVQVRTDLDRLRAASLMDHLHLPWAADHMASAARAGAAACEDSNSPLVAASLAWRGALLNKL